MRSLFIGIDVGSASVRAGVFDQTGKRLGFATQAILQFRPSHLQVEQSSQDIWAKTCLAVKEAVLMAKATPSEILGIGVDATCSLVAVGDKGQSISVSSDDDPEHDIIMWMDHRAGSEAALINATGDRALAYVGGEVGIEMELPKVLWLKRHFPERYQAAYRFFDLADYLVWRATDADVASVCTLTCKWNYLAHEGRFSHSLLEAVGLGDLPSKVPQTVLPLGRAAGALSEKAASDMGLPAGVSVATGIIDAHAGGLALVGAQPNGALALICGTSNCHMVAHPMPVMVPGVWGPYWGAMLPGFWLSEGGQSAAGALLDWTVKNHALWAAFEKTAQEKGASAYALLNRAVLDLEAKDPYPTRFLQVLGDHHGNRSPRANPNARGMVSGQTLEEGEAALARLYLATLQSIAYGTRHIIEAMNAAGHHINRIVMCGGGTKNAFWLRENADVTGCPIELVTEEDAVTLGAAILGAVAGGHFSDIPSACQSMVHAGETVAPRFELRAFHDAKYQTYLSLYADMEKHRHAMSGFISHSHSKERAK